MENTLTLMTLIGLMNTDGELEDPVIRCTTRCFEILFFSKPLLISWSAILFPMARISDHPISRSLDHPILNSVISVISGEVGLANC